MLHQLCSLRVKLNSIMEKKKKKAEGKKFRSVAISLSPPWGQSKKLGTAKKKNRNDGIKQNNDSSLGINKAEEN